MRIVQVDAFTDVPFRGNPAAVLVLDAPLDDAVMADIAREMNLSETAFVVARDEGGFDLRWFTPVVEVELCGHATLASAHVLWEDGHVEAGRPIAFHTRWAGVLGATDDDGWIELDLPSRPMTERVLPDEIGAAVGGSPVRSATGGGWLVEYRTEDEVRALEPDFGALRTRDDGYVIATAPGSRDGVDFVSRYFAPPAGIDEDPVTGSAHCALGPWWGERLGRDELLGRQVSARGGTVRVRLRGDRTLVAGQAVTVMRGDLKG